MTRSAALRVIAGRGAARGSVQLATVVLLPAWGAAEFGPFVAAIGTFGWLIYLVSGAEKALLTILPRTRVLHARYTGMLLARAATPLAVALLATAVLLPFGGRASLYATAAAFTAGQGLLSALAATHRIAGHPGRDTAAFLAFAGWVVILAGLAVVDALGPQSYLLALVAGLVVDSAVLALLIPAAPSRVRGGLSPRVNRRVVLLGLSDVADALSVSVLYVVLAAVATATEIATVYLVLLVSGLVSGLGVLLLRLAQPRFSLRLRGPGGQDGRRRARMISGRAAVVAATVLALAGIGLGTGVIGSSPLVIGAAALVELAVFGAVMYAVFLVENTNGVALSTTSAAASTGLAATVAAAGILIPMAHVVGALLALVAGLAAKAGFLCWRLPGGAVRRWRADYLRVVRSTFRTVPFYRERWALDGRTDPVVVPGRTGTDGGAVPIAEAVRRAADLVPLPGGSDAKPALGVLGGPRSCGHWHLDWRRVYARETPAGLAFTLLRQRSPRLVDIIPAEPVGSRLGVCPRHGTPVVEP